MAPIPRIDVVILTWNDGDLLSRSIESALSSEHVNVNVIVVDNGSQPPAAIPDDPRVVLMRNESNRGVAPARNQGVGLGGAPLVCLLDSDATLLPETIASLAELATGNVGLVAPVFSEQHPEESAGRAPGLSRKAFRALGLTGRYASVRRHADQSSWQVDFAIGACQLFQREAFDSIDGLDSTIFYGPEDVDFCLRLKAAGWTVMQTSSATCHHPPRRRNRALFTRRGLAHARAVLRHVHRHRRSARTVST